MRRKPSWAKRFDRGVDWLFGGNDLANALFRVASLPLVMALLGLDMLRGKL